MICQVPQIIPNICSDQVNIYCKTNQVVWDTVYYEGLIYFLYGHCNLNVK